MSVFSPGIEKALKGQKTALISEAEKAGATVLHIEDVTDSAENEGRRVMGSSAKVLFGGKMRADGCQLYLLETNGRQHVYVQPYTGGLPLPGEHHVILSDPLPGQLSAEETFFSTAWESADNAAFAKQLNADATMKKLVKKLEWTWPMGAGKIQLKWTAQTCTLPSGDTHFVMKAGRYGGIMTYVVGFSMFIDMMQNLATQTVTGQGRETMFVHPVNYAEWALQLLGINAEPAAAAADAADTDALQTREVDYRSVLRAALNGKLNKRIFCENMPEKKLNNARNHILPSDARDAELVVLIDSTVFKSAKTGVVFTPDMFYVREDDTQFGFPLRDLQVVGTNSGGNVNIKIAVKGEVAIPGAIEEDVLRDVLQAIADVNRR